MYLYLTLMSDSFPNFFNVVSQIERKKKKLKTYRKQNYNSYRFSTFVYVAISRVFSCFFKLTFHKIIAVVLATFSETESVQFNKMKSFDLLILKNKKISDQADWARLTQYLFTSQFRRKIPECLYWAGLKIWHFQ